MRDLLGGKGAGLAEMTNAGLPVPPGFTITTEACNDYFAAGEKLPDGLWDDVLEAVAEVERETGKGFGDAANPLLVSVRSGAKFSMPGMMDTVLNLGLNEQTLHGLIALTGNERFGWDAYRRFIQMFGRIVMDVEGEQFEHALDAAKARPRRQAGHRSDAAALRELVGEFLAIVREETGREFPTDPHEQLDLAIKAVFATWFGKRAHDYRKYNKIAHDLGTAVNVVTMVFGNMGDDSGTGVAFTRDPNTGEKVLFGEYLTNAQGEDVVAGIRTPPKISHMQTEMPEVYARVRAHRRAARAPLPRRAGPRVHDRARPAVHAPDALGQAHRRGRRAIAADMVDEGIITEREALSRIEPAHVDQLLRDQFDPTARAGATSIAAGLNASPGAAVGKAVFDADRAVEWVGRGEKVILVRIETSPDDFHGMAAAQGVLTARGGATSHAAVVARQIGKPCVAGCAALVIDYATTAAARQRPRLQRRRLDLRRRHDRRGVRRRAADDLGALRGPGRAPEGPRLGRRGPPARGLDQRRQARGSGPGAALRRAGHRPVPDRAHVPRGRAARHRARRDPRRLRQATRAKEKTRRRRDARRRRGRGGRRFDAAMGKLEMLQEGDFYGIFEAMDGLPVVIRLIDPPLHEFLPNHEEQLVEVTRAGDAAAHRGGHASCSRVEALHEQNPMLGLRGIRLGLMIPDLIKMQTRAILNAPIAVKKAGGHPHAEIMIPLVGHVNELAATQDLLEAEAKAVQEAAGVDVDFMFGTMIEIPRGALTADQIAEHAEFFSFGTNDLTQMTFGYSRDDAEGGFLLNYVERGILPANPFQTLDDAVVGLMRTAVEKGRARAPDLKIGICGEHGGDPASIANASGSGSTTCRARRSASRSRAWPRRRPRSPAPNATSSDRRPRVRTRSAAQPRWDPDERGHRRRRRARRNSRRLDALRLAADETGWVAEDPKSHLMPHLARHVLASHGLRSRSRR